MTNAVQTTRFIPWERPAFEEIKMDAELSSYVNDLDATAGLHGDGGTMAGEAREAGG